MKTFHILFLHLLLASTFSGCKNTYQRLAEVKNADETLYIVDQNDKNGVVDSNDKVIVPVEFENVLDISIGFMTAKNERYGLYNYQGKLLFPCKYEGFYNPYEGQDLFDVADSVFKTLYLVKPDSAWVELLRYEHEKYRVNFLQQPFFTGVEKGARLFCLYNIGSDTNEKIYKMDGKNVWTDVTSDTTLQAAINSYFDGDPGIPADQ